MKISIKLLSLLLILLTQSIPVFTMDLTDEEQLPLAISMSLDEQNSSRVSQASSVTQSNSISLSRDSNSSSSGLTESKIDSELKMKEELSSSLAKEETSAARFTKINKYRGKCLEEHIPRVLSDLVQQYDDPIKGEWKCEFTLKGHELWVNSICLLPENKLASGSTDGTVKIWDLKTYRCLKTLLIKGSKDFYAVVVSICSLLGDKLAIGLIHAYWNYIEIWNLDSYMLESVLGGHNSTVYKICPLSKNKLASCDPSDDKVKISNPLTNKYCSDCMLDHGNVESICSLPKNKLASGSRDGSIKIWNLNTGICEQILKGHTGWVHSLCSLQENKLASGDSDGTIKIWDLNIGECEHILIGHDWKVSSILLLENELVSSSGKTIKIWDLGSGKCNYTFCIDSTINSICLLPGNKLAIASDNKIEIWSNPVYSFNVPDDLDKILDNALDEYDKLPRPIISDRHP